MAQESESTGADDLGIPGLENPEFIGRGGAAIVYKATQASLQRTVAVKLLTSSWDESVARRFDREQRAMGKLSSRPGIVPVYESGMSETGVPFIIMPFYEAGSLKDWSEREGPVAWERAADIILDVADAVGSAHAAGIVHRDLKPANILLANNGKPLIADFGIARLASDQGGIETTAVTFTPAYCPPEVMDEVEPDPRADTYALAATFWALVRGRPPFTDSTTSIAMEAVLKRVLTEPPPHLDEAPPAIADFIDRAMSKEPEDRPAHGRAFAEELRHAIGLEAGTSPYGDADRTVISDKFRSTTPSTGESKLSRSETEPVGHRGVGAKGLLALVAATLLGGLLVFGLSRRSPTETSDTAVVEAEQVNNVTILAGDQITLQPVSEPSNQSLAEQTRRAVELAIADYGDIVGFPVQALPSLEIECGSVTEDTQAAITSSTASLLLGSTCLESASLVMRAAREIEMSWIASGISAPSLTSTASGASGSDHIDGFFRTSQNDHFQGAIAAQFAVDELDAETAAVIHGPATDQAEIAESFRVVFEATGDVQLLEIDGSLEPSATMAAAIDADVDVVFWVTDASTALDLANTDLPLSELTIVAVAEVLSETTTRQSRLKDAFVVTPLRPPGNAIAATGRSLDEIANAYVERFGENPIDSLALALSYDATVLALEAIEATAQLSSGDLLIDRIELRRHLESAESEGITGPLACDFLGDCGSQAMAVVQIDGVSVASTTENVVKLFDRAS